MAAVRDYRLGDPLQADTTLGPVVRTRNAQEIQAQVTDPNQAVQ